MMKSALATVAVAAVASTAAAAVPVYQLAGDNTVAAITCKTTAETPVEQIGYKMNIIPTATGVNTYYALYTLPGVDATVLDTCVETLTAAEAPVLTLMDGAAYTGCFAEETTGEGEGEVTTIVPTFTSDACYIVAKEKCTAGQKCQNIWFDAPAACPDVVAPATESTCPVEAPKNLFKTVTDYTKHYTEATKQEIPTELAATIAEIYAKANKDCTVYPARFAPADTTMAYGYVSNKKGTQFTSYGYYRGNCNFKTEIYDKVNEAIKAYNKDKEKDAQFVYDVKSSSASSSKDNISLCTTTTCGSQTKNAEEKVECDLPCTDEVTCTENKQCGSGVCAEEAAPATMKVQQDAVKKCTSNAILAAAAPVVAAVLAVAFF